MLHYRFPKINHIDDVLPIIEHAEGFIVSRRDLYTVINYTFASLETFPDIQNENNISAKIRRECRGLIFDLDGKLISRPYHKFFNLNERDETQQTVVDLRIPHKILEKLDGSMIRPIPIGGKFRLGTKAGITDIAMQAEVFIVKNPHYADFITSQLNAGNTPIFEWCSRKQRIVVDYPIDRLVLTGIRNNETGNYLELNDYIADYADIDVVRQVDCGNDGIRYLLQESSSHSDGEGWVIRFDDGHMLKIKADWYVLRHKSKDKLLQEKTVIEILVSDVADDIKSLLVDDDRHRFEKFEEEFWHGVNSYTVELETRINTLLQQANCDRKVFALQYAKELSNIEQGIAFGVLSGKKVYDQVLAVLRKNINTAASVDRVRFMWQHKKWEYGYE